MKKIVILMVLFLNVFWSNNYNYTEQQLADLKARALEEAQALMMQEIFNLTKDVRLNNTREELIENLCSTAPMNNFTVNADISDSLSQNSSDFVGSIFVSRDGQNTWTSSSDVALIGTEGYENTWATSVETTGGNSVDWYLGGLINTESIGLDYGNIIVSQCPNDAYNNSGSINYATIVTDDTGDAGSNYDIQNVLAGYSGTEDTVNQLLFGLDLAGSCCDEGGLFGPWYLYGVGIVNPDVGSTTSAYAIGYGNGGFGQLSPGLLTISGDLTSGDVAGFEYLTEDISYNESGDKLTLGVNADYLFGDSNFGEWPNSLEGLVLVGVVVEAGLSGLDIAVDVLDQTDVGIMLVNSQHQTGNSPVVLSNPSFDSESNQLSVSYQDADNNLPWYKAAQVCNTPENGGNCFAQKEMVPESHTYSEGVNFSVNIDDIIDEFDLSGDYEAHFWFADSDDLGEAQVEYDITIGNGSSCLLGDSNGDGLLNVLDVVLLVNLVLAPSYEECADVNGDETLNVLDVVTLVGFVLNP